MTIFGLNSPELFLILVITLIILGIKRIEKGFDLFKRLIKFLLSNQSTFDSKDKKKESPKGIKENQEKEEKIGRIEEKINPKEKESPKGIENTQKIDDKSDKNIKVANLDKKENKLKKTKSPKGIRKDKDAVKSKTISVQKEQLEK